MSFIEKLLFQHPTFFYKLLSFLLLPFSFLYCFISIFTLSKKRENLGIPILSIGNVIVGGSGKTPLAIALTKRLSHKRGAVILRGYKRESSGVIVVRNEREIVCDVQQSGDEAMEIALLSEALVIVSENRREGILKAKEMGAEFVILDDGFRHPFKKLNIVIDQEINTRFCLPSGGYRYPKSFLKKADLILKEGRDFTREVRVPQSKNTLLVSAISKPERLLKYTGEIKHRFFLDHHTFRKEELVTLLEKEACESLLVTMKDYVKIKDFGIKTDVISLHIELDDSVVKKIEEYVVKF